MSARLRLLLLIPILLAAGCLGGPREARPDDSDAADGRLQIGGELSIEAGWSRRR